MVSLKEVETRLSRIGLRNRYWGKPEVRELQHIIMPEEEITGAVNGRYEGGFALLVATDRRLLLIDKKIMFLTMEDVRFDMISEVDFYARLLDASVSIRTINKSLRFTSIRQGHLRRLTSYVQQRVMELRQFAAGQLVNPLPMTQDPATKGYLIPNVASTPVQSPLQRPKAPAYPSSSLTMRHRISRFYPT